MSQPARFFVALLPPQAVQEVANQVKQYFSDRYASRAAQKSPPHITLQPPFQWPWEQLPSLEQRLAAFAQQQLAVPVTLEGYGAFPPRVIYIHVHASPELLALQSALQTHLAPILGQIEPTGQSRPFVPHMTVAFRDLTTPNFRQAWAEFAGRSLYVEFVVTHLTLLLHDGQRWMVHREFPLAS